MNIERPQKVDAVRDHPQAPGETIVTFDAGLPTERSIAMPLHVWMELGAAFFRDYAAGVAEEVEAVRALGRARMTSIVVVREETGKMDS